MPNQHTPSATVFAGVLSYEHHGDMEHVPVGTTEWYRWLQSASHFRVLSPQGTITVRKEQAGNHRGQAYWRAYRRHQGSLQRVYLGLAEEVTLERLTYVSESLCPMNSSADAAPFPADTTRQDVVAQRRFGTPMNWTVPAFPPLPPLIAREAEIEHACALLRQSDVRLLTLTGAGGVGKTSLARVIATALQPNFANGACFVALVTIHDATFVVPAILQALGVRADPQIPFDVIRKRLQGRHLLLVLDNFEQVLPAAPLLVDLLAICHDVKLLVTSRERLNVQGECLVEVHPLPVPDPLHSQAIAALANYGAVALFLRCAQLIRPTLQLTSQTAPLISAICRRVEGLPLALELAAARLQLLSLAELLKWLEQPLSLLTGGPRDVPAHQQSLRRTIDWSYQLLSREEQRLFRVLAVFRNGGTFEAVAAVYRLLGEDTTWVVEGITSLLNKHLLYRLEHAEQASRLMMHESLQEYGLEALDATQEMDDVQQAHAAYYLQIAAHQLEDHAVIGWIDQVEREFANLHAALEWSLKRPASALSLHLEAALGHFWQGYHRLGTSERVMPSLIAISHDQHDIRHPARLHYILGMLAWMMNDAPLARLHAAAGIDCARAAQELLALAYLTDLLGQIALDQGYDTRAQTLFEQGLAHHRAAGDQLGSLNALFYLERTLAQQGKLAQARSYAQEHLTLALTLQFSPGIIGTLTLLGRLALEEGDWPTAARYFQESISLMREASENQSLTIATNVQGIGVTLAKLGRLPEAVRLWGAAMALGMFPPEERAFVARAREAVQAALDEQAFSLAWEQGQKLTLEHILAEIGELVTRQPMISPMRSPANRGRHHDSPGAVETLTPRQMEVLRLVAQGLTDAQIANRLIISPRTVNAHLRAVYAKLQISSRHAATYYAVEYGLV